MEKVVDTSVNISLSDNNKPSSPSSSNTDDVSTKFHGTINHAAHNSKMVSPVHNQENYLGLSSTGIEGGGGVLGNGPTGKYNGEANEVNVCDDVFGSCVGYERFGTYSQPFGVFPYPDTNSSGMGFSFTHAQRKELERQDMIYKYMISSVPVPRDLLFPDQGYAVDSSATSVNSVMDPKNGSDAEPGRCKRTDGKKWRCSRDVAPHHKYCERHLHRSRPRSRKLVEAKSSIIGENHKKTQARLRRNSALLKSTDAKNETARDSLYNNAGTELSIFGIGSGSSSSYKETHRDLGLIMGSEGHINGIEEQHLEESNAQFSNMGHSLYGSYGESLWYDQGYIEQDQPLDVFSHSNLTVQAPIGFFDACSVPNLNNTEVAPYLPSPNHRNLSPPSLSLSMGNIILEGNRASASYCNNQEPEDGFVSWKRFARGPLGEALQAGSVVSSNTASPYSAPVTTSSSPSGFHHKASFLHSDDNSVCNSPTSESGFWWPN